jgi:hypothetical protein
MAWRRAHMSYRLRPGHEAQAARHNLSFTRRMASHVIGKPGAIAAAGYGVALLGDRRKRPRRFSPGGLVFIRDLDCG